MRVNLTAQVLSETVGNVLNNFGPEEAVGTRQFLITGDKFFDSLNVRNTKKHFIKRKLFLKPNESIDDNRFVWLDGFLQYFKSWKGYNEARNDANYTETVKSKMFVSWQSSEGLQITVLSVKEGFKLWLQQGVPYIFSERFCHDDLGIYFGKQRGGRSDNPTVHDFGYNGNTVKNRFSIRPIGGNVQGPAEKFNEICHEPLLKLRK